MLRLDREQAISVAAFVLLLLVSVTVMGMSLQARAGRMGYTAVKKAARRSIRQSVANPPCPVTVQRGVH